MLWTALATAPAVLGTFEIKALIIRSGRFRPSTIAISGTVSGACGHHSPQPLVVPYPDRSAGRKRTLSAAENGRFPPAAPPPASRLRSKGHSRVGGCQRDVRRRGQDPAVSQEGVLDAPGGRAFAAASSRARNVPSLSL